MATASTRDRILDVAERLFAADGVKGTSLRAITGEATVNLAAVGYHFGSKEALVEAVLERRLGPLNDVRLQNLAAVRAAARERGRPPATAAVLRAFLEPTLRFRDSGPGAAAFVALVGRALAGSDEELRGAFLERVASVFEALGGALEEALPHLPAGVVALRLQFAQGAFGQAMCAPHLSASPTASAPVDTEEALSQLVAFVAAGMEAP